MNRMKKGVCVLLVLGMVLSAGSVWAHGETENTEKVSISKYTWEPKAKYVFLFIGDGMAMPQIKAAEAYSSALSETAADVQKLRFSQFPVAGLTTTHDAGSLITDSASAGTAIATGYKTLSGVINMDPGKTRDYKTISSYAAEKGMKVGIVSSVSLDHATPACFYSYAPSRSNYYDISVQLASSGFDYFGGGGLKQITGKNGDQPDVLKLAEEAGYTIVQDRAGFQALSSGAGKVLAIEEKLQDSSAMPYEIDREEGALSLADFTAKGIELLSDDPDGFFLMVEGGKIDWAGHANDAASVIGDTLAFDAAIAEAVAFADKHPLETLIVVTGDHETGGMTIGFAGTKYATFFDKIAPQQMSFTAFVQDVMDPYKKRLAESGRKGSVTDIIPAVEKAFGIRVAELTPLQKEQLQLAFERSLGNEVIVPVEEDSYLLYGGYDPFTVKLTQVVNQNAGIGWTSYSHTGVPVATFAKGVQQELFSGYYDNTDIFYKLMQAMDLQ